MAGERCRCKTMERGIAEKMDPSPNSARDTMAAPLSSYKEHHLIHVPREYEARSRANGRAAQWRMLSQQSRKAFEEDLNKNRNRLRQIENKMARREAEPIAQSQVGRKGKQSQPQPQPREQNQNQNLEKNDVYQEDVDRHKAASHHYTCLQCTRLQRKCAKCFGIEAYENASIRHLGTKPEEVPSWDSSIPEREYRRIRPTTGYNRVQHTQTDSERDKLIHKLQDRETEAILGRTRRLRIKALYESNRLRQMVTNSKSAKYVRLDISYCQACHFNCLFSISQRNFQNYLHVCVYVYVYVYVSDSWNVVCYTTSECGMNVRMCIRIDLSQNIAGWFCLLVIF